MKNILRNAFLLCVAAGALSGCGGSSSSSGNTSLPTTPLHARLVQNGAYTAWPSAGVYAQALPGNYNCSPSVDPNCITNIQGKADSSGNYNVSSNAIPGIWNVGAIADSNCSSGAGISNQQLSAGVVVQLTCNNINNGTSSVSPSTCNKNVYSDGSSDTSCPSTVTVTIGGNAFPTNHAMVVGTYTETGSSLSSQNISASSPTTLVMPVPTRQGDNVLIVRDPNNNRVLGSALFTYTIWRQAPCTAKTCPPPS